MFREFWPGHALTSRDRSRRSTWETHDGGWHSTASGELSSLSPWGAYRVRKASVIMNTSRSPSLGPMTQSLRPNVGLPLDGACRQALGLWIWSPDAALTSR